MEHRQTVDTLPSQLSTEMITTATATTVSTTNSTCSSSSRTLLPTGTFTVSSHDSAALQLPHPVDFTDARTCGLMPEARLPSGNSDRETIIHSLIGIPAMESIGLVAPSNLSHGTEILVQWPPAAATPTSRHLPIDLSVSLLSGETSNQWPPSSSSCYPRSSRSTPHPPPPPLGRAGSQPTVSETVEVYEFSSSPIWRVRESHELSPSALNGAVSIKDRINSFPEVESKRGIASSEGPSVSPSMSLPFLNTSPSAIKEGNRNIGGRSGRNGRHGNRSAPRRPNNSFMLYKKKILQDNRALFKFLNMSGAQISSHVAQSWRKEPEHVKLQYETLADIERLVFLNAFPNYRYRKSASSVTTIPTPASLPSSTRSGISKVSRSAGRVAVGSLSSPLKRLGSNWKKTLVESTTTVGEQQEVNDYPIPEVSPETTAHHTHDQSVKHSQRSKKEDHLKDSGYVKSLATAEENNDTDPQDSAI